MHRTVVYTRVMEAAANPVEVQPDPSLLRRVGRYAGRVAGLAAVGLTFGLTATTFVPVHSELGPHNTDVQTTGDGVNTVDAGPIGSASWVSNSPLGVKITLKEIPEGIAGNNELTQDDFNRYFQLYSNAQQDSQSMRKALLERAGQGFLLGDGAAVGFFLLLGPQRRKELYDRTIEKKRPLMAAAFLTTAVLAPGVPGNIKPSGAAVIANPIYKDTILEGATIKGKILIELINKYGPQAVELYRQNKVFYQDAQEQLNKSFEATNDKLLPDSQSFTVLVASDKHCNVGMDEVEGRLVKLYNPSLVLDPGDSTMGGTQLEERCIDSSKKATGNKTVVAVRGNHDSEVTEAQQRKKGIKVLDGKTININGFTILGDGDPMRSEFGQEAHQIGPESNSQMGIRLARQSCIDHPNIIVVHEPAAAKYAAEYGCADLVINGHTHKFDVVHITNQIGQVIPRLTAGTAGGAKEDNVVIGPLKDPAVMTILSFNKVSKKPIGYQNITVNTDSTVEIGSITYFEAN